MCIFLSIKDIANKLIQDNETLVVQGQNIKLKKAIQPGQKNHPCKCIPQWYI